MWNSFGDYLVVPAILAVVSALVHAGKIKRETTVFWAGVMACVLISCGIYALRNTPKKYEMPQRADAAR